MTRALDLATSRLLAAWNHQQDLRASDAPFIDRVHARDAVAHARQAVRETRLAA